MTSPPPRRTPSSRTPAGHPADSAGTPWSGRELGPQPFGDDDGAPDPALAAALAALPGATDPQVLTDALAALAGARLLVPVVAVAQDTEKVQLPGMSGPTTREVSTAMAVVTLQLPDGVRALPVFTGLPALTAWRPDARPVAVGCPQAALSAVDEGCTALLVDAAGPLPTLLPRAVLWALAQARRWSPPAHDQEVLEVLQQVAAGLEPVRSVAAGSLGWSGLRVVLGLPGGLGREQVEALLAQARAALAASPVLAERVDSLEVGLTRAHPGS